MLSEGVLLAWQAQPSKLQQAIYQGTGYCIIYMSSKVESNNRHEVPDCCECIQR